MDAFKLLQTHDMVRDMPGVGNINDLCDACQFGKMHREYFSSIKVTWEKNKLSLFTLICVVL